MENIFDISYLITAYGYVGVFIVVFLESGIFFPLPGDSLLFSVGILASSGVLSIHTGIFIIFVATFFGSVAGYYMGTHIKRLRKYPFFAKFLKDKHIDKAHEFFEKHGRVAMLFSRFIPVVRTFVPIVAGMARMHEKTFILWNLAGAVLWSAGMTLLGYFLGELLPNSKDYVHYVLIIVVLFSLVPLFWGLLKKKVQAK
jgi:membrane-associated protein